MELRHILVSLLWLSVSGAHGSIAERKLLTKLFENYNSMERPTIESKDAVTVTIGMSLLSIINADSKTNTLETIAWFTVEWNDPNLRWTPTDYDNITDLRIPPSKIWKPDAYLYNSAHELFDATFETLAVLRSNGSIVYVPPGIHKTSCGFDMRYYPYDEQRCNIKLGSWSHDGGQIDLQLYKEEKTADVSSYAVNSEWMLIAVPATRDAVYYTCCPEPYVSVTFTVHMRRRGHVILLWYKVINSFICLMILLSFAMPAASGQKLAMGIVTLIVNICTIASINSMLPSHHDSKLAFYFAELSSLAFSSVFANLLTVYIYYRRSEMPALMRRLLDRTQRSYVSLICPKWTYEINEAAEDNHNPSYVASNEDTQGLINEINSLKRKISLQTKTQQLISEWNYLASVVDRCFIIVYALCIFIFYISLFPSFNTSEDGIVG